MKNTKSVTKDINNQSPIPSVWRATLSAIIEAIKESDFQLIRGISDVPILSDRTADAIKNNIEDYGVHLSSLPEEAWDTSVCQWMGTYWDVMVDLFTEEEGSSDLVLSVRVRELSDGYTFDVFSVHVP